MSEITELFDIKRQELEQCLFGTDFNFTVNTGGYCAWETAPVARHGIRLLLMIVPEQREITLTADTVAEVKCVTCAVQSQSIVIGRYTNIGTVTLSCVTDILTAVIK